MGARNNLVWLGLAVTVALLGPALAETPGPDPVATMREAMQPKACRACHAAEKDRARLADPYLCCSSNCERCHEDMTKHHPTVVAVQDKDKDTDKVQLPLLGSKKVGCISCHDLKAPATDTKSWKSESLYARLFQHQATYKTYYLRINNSSGKLCKTCH